MSNMEQRLEQRLIADLRAALESRHSDCNQHGGCKGIEAALRADRDRLAEALRDLIADAESHGQDYGKPFSNARAALAALEEK